MNTETKLARATGQREATEQFLAALRQHLAAWRNLEAGRGPLARALFWSLSEAWTSRIESFAAAVEQHVGTLKGAEQQLSEAVQAERVAAVEQHATTVRRRARPAAKARKRR